MNARRATRAAVVVSCLVSGLVACNPQPPKSTPKPSSAASPTPTPVALHISGQGTSKRALRFFWQQGNRVEVEIVSSAFESKGPQTKMHGVFQNARVTFNGRDGSRLYATAPQAIFDQTTNTVTLIGGVSAHSATGIRLQCMQLVYDRKSQLLHGTGNVVVTDPKGSQLTGPSITSDLSLTHVKIP